MSGICIADHQKFTAQVLPKLPANSLQLWQNISEGKLEYRKLAQIVETDPILAGEVIRIANSTFYGLQGKVGNVLRAVILLGNKTIVNLVRGLIVRNAGFSCVSLTKEQQQRIWSHNLATAIMARSLANQSNLCDPDEAFLAALIHDLGKLIDPGDEQQHVELASLLCSHWNLPEHVGQSILWHHQSELPNHHPISGLHSVLRTANNLAKIIGYYCEEDDFIESATIQSFLSFKGKIEHLRQAIVQFPQAYAALAIPFKLSIPDQLVHTGSNSTYIGLSITKPCFKHLFDLIISSHGYTPAAYYGPRQDNLRISLLVCDNEQSDILQQKSTLEIPRVILEHCIPPNEAMHDRLTCKTVQHLSRLMGSLLMKGASHV